MSTMNRLILEKHKLFWKEWVILHTILIYVFLNNVTEIVLYLEYNSKSRDDFSRQLLHKLMNEGNIC